MFIHNPKEILQPMLIKNTKVTERQIDRLRGLYAQPKLDGIRITIQSISENEQLVLTRGNKQVRKEIANWVLEQLSSFYHRARSSMSFVDGELIYDNDCAATAGIVHSIHQKVDTSKLKLFIFDVVEFNHLDDTLEYRLSRNAKLINVPSWKHKSFEDSYQRAEQFAESHGLVFEGFVLKPANSTYQFGKRLDGSYKYKLQAEMDCIIDHVVQMEDAQGNTKPMAGYFVCHPVNAPSSSINVTASCSNELRTLAFQRADELNGKAIITIRYMDVPSGKTNSGLVRMPRYISGLEHLLDNSNNSNSNTKG